jgi:hypothetical protein
MKPLRIANIAALLITLLINFLSQTASSFGIELFPRTIAELGESRAIFFLPAGYVFGIWGIIYTGLIVYAIFQARQDGDALDDAIGPWFIISCVANALWLILFLADAVALSTVAMLVILASLLIIYQRLGIGRQAVERARLWAVHVPFSIYLGWISVATIANFAAALYEAGQVTAFLGLSADLWAVVMMAVAFGLTGAMLWLRRDVAFAGVVIWSLVGIYARPFSTATFAPLAAQNIDLVNAAALGLAVGVGLVMAGIAFMRRQAA